jgi:hypothetical protein
MGSLGQATGALHSRTTEKSIAATKNTKANLRVRIHIYFPMQVPRCARDNAARWRLSLVKA